MARISNASRRAAARAAQPEEPTEMDIWQGPITKEDADIIINLEWLDKAGKREKSRQIALLRQREEQGEDIGHSLTQLMADKPVSGGNESEIRLPDPEKPKKYSAKSKTEYDNWVRQIELFQESRKLSTTKGRLLFAEQYLDTDNAVYWRNYVKDLQLRNASYEPSWAIMKQKMLDRLGKAWIRAQKAFADIAKLKQDGREPLKLLNDLRELWVEANMVDSRQQIHSFINALDPAEKKAILYYQEEEPEDLEQAEDRATRAWRSKKLNQDQKSTKEHKKPSNESQQIEGGHKRLYEDKESLSNHKRNKWVEKKDKDDFKIRGKGEYKEKPAYGGSKCWNCGKQGHHSDKCSEPSTNSKFKPDFSKPKLDLDNSEKERAISR